METNAEITEVQLSGEALMMQLEMVFPLSFFVTEVENWLERNYTDEIVMQINRPIYAIKYDMKYGLHVADATTNKNKDFILYLKGNKLLLVNKEKDVVAYKWSIDINDDTTFEG